MTSDSAVPRCHAVTRGFCAVVAAVALTALATAAAPAGWILAGSDPASYAINRDTEVRHGAAPSASLVSAKASSGFGTMMQMFAADDYAGKRMRLSGWVKASDVSGWAGLWMRVDGAAQPPLAFDNMQSRPIKGTSDWTRYEVVLDVAPEAKAVAFGILLGGEGSVWLSDVKFEAVPTTVPTTGTGAAASKRGPENLDFEH